MSNVHKLNKNQHKINSFAFKLLKKGIKLVRKKKLKISDGSAISVLEKNTKNYRYLVDLVQDTRILKKPYVSVFAFKRNEIDYYYGLRKEI
jgi:hypothetical protein